MLTTKLKFARAFPQDIRDDDGCIFATTENTVYDYDAQAAHAAELVKRWNTQPELLEALQAALPWLSKAMLDGAFKNCALPLAPNAVIKQMHDAIQKSTAD